MSTEDQRTFRVGLLTDVCDSDPFVTGWDAALKAAEERYKAFEPWDNEAIGIWFCSEDGDYTLDGIYFEGDVFT